MEQVVPEFISVQVTTLRELLSGDCRLQLPWFQRAYAWDTEKAGCLLTHVSEAAKSEDPYYLLGTIVIAKAVNQRSVLRRALRDHGAEMPAPHSQALDAAQARLLAGCNG